jgi:murein DD-endopeptidase MepM/ murein hydrolase activator NlpD
VVDTSTKYQFIYPVESVKTLNSFAFYQNSTLKNYYVHRGIDFSATSGTPVLACLDGVVESIKTGSILNGTQITLSHENGIKTIYTYVDANPELQVGDAVQRGDVIGTVADATGCEYRDGSHLHFEVYSNGKLTDPDTYLDGGVK